MTFYQELQLNQAGSKKVIRESETAQEKWRHILIYLLKIAITVGFCFVFVTLYSLIFGAGNSIVGVVVLLHLLVFKNADLRIDAKQSAGLLALFFGIMTVAPHLANLANPFVGLLIHAAAISILILFGCHEPRMFNQSTLVLSYLLLYGYDVSGTEYLSRLAGMAVGALLVCAVFYKNHRHQTYDLRAQDILPAFTLTHMRSKWQLCQILCVPLVLFLSELFGLPRAMWAGIAAMSAILPVMDDMHARVRGRILGNIAGVLCFFVLYTYLPSAIYAYIGVIGGIGVGFSAKYGWQAVFNTFGAPCDCIPVIWCAHRHGSARLSERVRRAVRLGLLLDFPLGDAARGKHASHRFIIYRLSGARSPAGIIRAACSVCLLF